MNYTSDKTGKLWLGKNGLSLAIGTEFFPFFTENVTGTTAVGLTEYGAAMLGNIIFSPAFAYDEDLVRVISESVVTARGSVTAYGEATITGSSSIDVTATKLVCVVPEIMGETLILADADDITVLASDSAFVRMARSTATLIYATTSGIYAYSISDLTEIGYAVLSNITSIALNNNALYIGTSDAGVYSIDETTILAGGNFTASLVQTFTTGSTPSIASNTVVWLDAYYTGNELAIVTSAGIDFLPDSSLSTKYSMTQAGVTQCSINDTRLGYICADTAYTIDLPTANFSLASTDVSGIKPLFFEQCSLDSGIHNAIFNTYMYIFLDYYLLSCDNYEYWLYEIDPVDDSITEIDTYSWYANDNYYAHSKLFRGGYLFIYAKYTIRSALRVLKYASESFSNIFSEAGYISTGTGGYPMLVNNTGTVILLYTDWVGTLEETAVRQWYRYTRSGDTISGHTATWIPRNIANYRFTNYDVILCTYESKYTLLSSSGSVVTQLTPHTSLASNFVHVGNSDYFVACEAVQVDATTWAQYLTLYSATASAITYRDTVYMFDSGLIDGVTNAYNLTTHGDYIFVTRHRYIYDGSYHYQEPIEYFVYTVYNNTIAQVGGGISISVTHDIVKLAVQPVGVGYSEGDYLIIAFTEYDISEDAYIGDKYFLLKVNSDTALQYSVANSIDIEADNFIGTDIGVLVELDTDRTICRVIDNALGNQRNVTSLEASANAGSTSGLLAYSAVDTGGDGQAGIFDIANGVKAITPRTCSGVTQTWQNSLTLWGYNGVIFHEPFPAQQFSNFLYVSIMESGTFNSYKTRVLVDNAFIEVTKDTAVYLVLDPSTVVTDFELSVSIFDREFSYTVLAGDSLEDVGEVIAAWLISEGFEAVGTSYGLVVGSLTGLLAIVDETALLQRDKNPVARIKISGVFQDI